MPVSSRIWRRWLHDGRLGRVGPLACLPYFGNWRLVHSNRALLTCCRDSGVEAEVAAAPDDDRGQRGRASGDPGNGGRAWHVGLFAVAYGVHRCVAVLEHFVKCGGDEPLPELRSCWCVSQFTSSELSFESEEVY